ncbi:MAG: lantibiotic modifying-like protein [Thermomicrobia bacterium]|nr:lantibiotic modifying-like protein [Thermomicrobia bacterium]
MWDGGVTSVSYLEAAGDAARWIRSTARAADHGLVWLPDPDRPERSATITAPATIYSGNAGIVLFFLELAEATGDASYLDDARRGADQIAATWREVLTFPSLIPVDNVNLAFNMGLSGTAFVLAQVWRATRDATYRDAAFAITTQIADAARPVGAGVEWVGAASAGLGDGSIILFLLWAAEEFGERELRELAARAGARILEVAEPDPDARFLHAAREGAAHVQAIATVRGDAALLAYREPDMADLFYLGYCHGPVGTARTFYALSRITGEPAYAEWLGRFARGVMTTGIPEKQTPGLWNVVCQCCGTAGIADFFVSLWIATREPEYLTFAKRVADATLSRATDFDGQGNRWYQAWTRTKPWEVTAETGYMIGAAGVGSALLHLHLAEGGKYRAILFPDNPFPRGMGEPQ